MSDRMIRAALAMVASFGVLLALFGAVGAKAQEVDYDRLRPIFQITGDVCKSANKAAMMVWEAKRNGFLRREWMMGIARSIGAQAELALLRDFDLDDAEAEALAGRLAMRDFMGEMVDRIYQPELYQWVDDDGASIGMCSWVGIQCQQWVVTLIQDEVYAEEAAAFDEWIDEWIEVLTGEGIAEEERLEASRLLDILLDRIRPAADKCIGKLGGYPHEVSGPSALPIPSLFNRRLPPTFSAPEPSE